mmetsp:Transcript_31122/g.59135  ORF Transcript_31122/g.59135 Transcript_31122/m.59135 type:complete len:208 (+) Transcript_31122:2149-2772(+)
MICCRAKNKQRQFYEQSRLSEGEEGLLLFIDRLGDTDVDPSPSSAFCLESDWVLFTSDILHVTHKGLSRINSKSMLISISDASSCFPTAAAAAILVEPFNCDPIASSFEPIAGCEHLPCFASDDPLRISASSGDFAVALEASSLSRCRTHAVNAHAAVWNGKKPYCVGSLTSREGGSARTMRSYTGQTFSRATCSAVRPWMSMKLVR